MRETKHRYALFFWLTAGWLLGAVGVNRLFASGLINSQVLYGFVTDGWLGAMEGQKAAVWRIAAVRMMQTAAVVGICRSRIQSFGIPFLLVLTGLAGSTSLVVFTWCRGLEGLWCFLISGFPHQLFYLAAWWLLAYRYGYGLSARRGRFWSAVISLTAGGMAAEIRLNPLFLRLL